MSCEILNIDTVTQRPRTPNDPYTCLTDQQISGIKRNAAPFFHSAKGDSSSASSNPPPKVGGRHYRDRYSDTSVGAGGNPLCWIGDQWCRHPPVEYNTCQPRASVRWGPNKSGERTRSHFYGESKHRYTNIDMYRQNPKAVPGPVFMTNGRPTTGYYAQMNPIRTTWFGSSVPLNRTSTLSSAPAKTAAQHQANRTAQQTARLSRAGKWPEYTEYTDRYLLNGNTLPPVHTGITEFA